MCGIVAALFAGSGIKTGNLACVRDGLRRLEYRGYDSCGIGWHDGAALRKVRVVGDTSRLPPNAQDVAQVAIGHTRWATHGGVTEANAHPHQSADGAVMIVHNGIVENADELRDELIRRGVFDSSPLESETDTAILANLLAFEYSNLQEGEEDQRGRTEAALRRCVERLHGTFAVAAIFADAPDRLYAMRRGSPACFGIADDGSGPTAAFVASDPSAFAPHARHAVLLEDDEILCIWRENQPEETAAGTTKKAAMFGLRHMRLSASGSPGSKGDSGTLELIEPPREKISTSVALGHEEEEEKDEEQEELEETSNGDEREQHHAYSMSKEIAEQPSVARRFLRGRYSSNKSARGEEKEKGGGGAADDTITSAGTAASVIRLGGLSGPSRYFRSSEPQRFAKLFPAARRVLFAACGSSLHAAEIGARALEHLGGVPAVALNATDCEETSRPSVGDVLVCMTQSGETLDTLLALRRWRAAGLPVFALCNVPHSSVFREAHAGIYLRCGPERAVASTKSYVCQLLGVLLLALSVAHGAAAADDVSCAKTARDRELALAALHEIPNALDATIRMCTGPARELADRLRFCSSVFVAGRGLEAVTAREAALKLKEIGLLHAEGFSAAEFKHGPFALLSAESAVIFVSHSSDRARAKSSLAEIRARGAFVVEVSDRPLSDSPDFFLPIAPTLSRWAFPVLSVVPFQILSLEIALRKHLNPDRPRNLAKCVTVG